MSLSSRLTLSSNKNPCPVCDNVSGACRILPDDTIFCHGLADAKKGEKVSGYLCVKVATGHTATFKPDNSEEWSAELRQQWQERKAKREQEAEDEQLRRQEQALSVEERHELYSDILNQLNLDLPTNLDLKRRGFTQDEIERSGFKSVERWQPLNKEYDKRLPGIGKDGRSLAVGHDGYLCPIRDVEGRITGLQVRLHTPVDDNRYRWLSTPELATLKLQPEDENPIAVFHPLSGKPDSIAIVEGTGAKPFFVSQRLNALVIGAAGGQWLSSDKLLEKYIKEVTNKYGELPIQVIPDAGWALNSQVKQKLTDLFDWLKIKFNPSIISVLDWNQVHKSQGDIDELDDLSIARTLSVKSFLKKYKEAFGLGFAVNRYQQWAESRVQLTADIIQNEKWLTIPAGIQNECDILLIRKPLGGGKTQGLIEFLKPLDTVSLLVGYRNSLLNNTISRANVMGVNASHIKDISERVDGSYINFGADDSIKLWGGCADSFFKFNAIISHNPDYYLIHDEICSVLGHLKGGGTLKSRQQQAIEWDVTTIKNSQFSIMMDANLSDREVNFIRSLFPDKRIKVLDSISPVDSQRTFYFLETSSSEDYSAQPKYLPSQLTEIAKKHDRVLWISDSQRSCEVADEILTKHGHKHYRLDGKTSHDEPAKQFQSAPKQFIQSEQLNSVSISPSGESGLSIDLFDYFDVVCFDIRGTVGVNTLTQLSARLRDTKVPIYVACPEFVNMTSDPCPYAIKNVNEVINQRIDQVLIQSMSVDKELTTSQFVFDMFVEMAQKFANDPWFVESMKDAKQLKYEHQNLKLTLKTALTQAGHRAIDYVEAVDDGQYEECKEVKEFVKRREAEKIFHSADISHERTLELAKQDVNYDVKCQIRKARLKHQLPGIEETESWKVDFIYSALIDQPKFLGQRWRLKQLQDEELFKAVFKNEHKYNFEFGFEANDIWKSTSTKIDALKLLGVGKIIEAGSFSTQDIWVQEIVNMYYDTPEWFNLIGIPKAKRSLNDDGSPKNLQYVKKMVDRFLDFFGLEARMLKIINGSRFFDITTPSHFNEFLPDIDDCLNRKARKIIEEMRDVSLKGIVDKAEDTRLQQQQSDNQQAELNKQILEVQVATAEIEEWQKPGALPDLAKMLDWGKYSEAVTRSKVAIEMVDWKAFQAFKFYLNTPVRKMG